MTQRERLLRVLEGKSVDVMPWYADLRWWHEVTQSSGKLDEQYRGEEGLVRLHRDLGAGIFLSLDGVWEMEYDGIERCETQHEDLVVEEIHTPAGTLRSVRRPVTGGCLAHLERFVKSVDDLRAFRYYIESAQPRPAYETYLRKEALWGDQGIPVVFVNGSPLGTIFSIWAGIETLAYLMADVPEEMKKTLDVMSRAYDPLFEIVAHSPAKIVELGENLSAELIGGYFEHYSAEYYRYRVERLHAAGKFVGTHLDGTIGHLLSMLARTGLDYAEALTPAPVGDVPLEELRGRAGDRMVLWGGVPGAMFAPPFGASAMEAHIRRLCELYACDGRFIVGTADQVPPNGDIGLVGLISEVLQQWAN